MVQLLQTETTDEVPWVATSAVITALKAFIDGYSTTSSVTYSFGYRQSSLMEMSTDGKYDDVAFQLELIDLLVN